MLLPHNVNTRLKTNRFVKCVYLSILLIDQVHISENTVVLYSSALSKTYSSDVFLLNRFRSNDILVYRCIIFFDVGVYVTALFKLVPGV